MTANKPRQPISYSGTGSAIDNYLKSQNIDCPPQEKPIENWAMFDKSNTKHLKVLSLCRQAKWTTDHEKYGEVADLERLSNWLKSEKCPVKKPLKKMDDTTELPKVIKALTGIVKSIYK
jgi:hypothetical protein